MEEKKIVASSKAIPLLSTVSLDKEFFEKTLPL